MTEKFVNPRSGEEEECEYIVNASGAIHSVSPDHPAVKVSPGRRQQRRARTYAYFRFATNAEILRYVRKVERIGERVG